MGDSWVGRRAGIQYCDADSRGADCACFICKPLKPATEWQCTCGAWVPIGYSRHPHVVATQPKFEDLHAMRIAAEAGLTGVVKDVLGDDAEITSVLRTKGMPTR